MSDSPGRFPALQSRNVSDLLNERATLATLARSIGTPFHVVFPEQIAENIGEFRSVLQEEGLPGEVFFAAKAFLFMWRSYLFGLSGIVCY
ncbi:hypothetical protein IPG41_00305 [Candidatus Peregrinibacteria bacterium]|nr:MAG: hypothetical protein IPG41_00305 [Candidatus Peregrinibacteria bacterium]